MSAVIETPEAMAARLCGGDQEDRLALLIGIRADREAIAAALLAKAEHADKGEEHGIRHGNTHLVAASRAEAKMLRGCAADLAGIPEATPEQARGAELEGGES